MTAVPIFHDEVARLRALNNLELLDTANEAAFDELTRLAAQLLDVPIALVSLVDTSRQWFKSRVGLDTCETSREASFCAHAILDTTPFIVADTQMDARFHDNPLVTGAPYIRAYLGIPLLSRDGYRLGTLCVIDRRPRNFDAREIDILTSLAGLVQREILHRENAVRGRRVAEASLDVAEETSQAYRAVFNQAAIGIAIVSLDGRWLQVNPALCRVLDRSETQLLEGSFQDVTHPADLDIDLGLMAQLMAGESDHYTLEKRYLRPDGGILWCNLTVTLVRTDGGDPGHFVSVVEDITRRRSTEQALHALRLQLEDRVAERTSELQRTNEFLAESIQRVQRSEAALADRKADLRAVLTNAHDAYICIDANGLVVDWNKQAEKIFGWNAEEVIGRRLDELIVPLARREGHRRGLESLSASGVARMLDRRLEMPALRRDGTVFPCEMTVTALASRTRGQLFAVFLQDISSRKEAQRSLSAAHERLEDLYQHAPCGYYSLDAAGSFCEINEGALQLFESDREALIGKRSPRDFMTEIGRARFSEVYHEFMLTGHFGPEEFDFIGAGGRMRRVSIRATALRDTQGRYLRSRTVAIDVTELHRTRLALQASNRQQHLMLDNELFGIVKLQNRVTVWANRAFARMFGYSPEEVHQLPMRSLYEDDETFERMGAEAYAAIANGEAYRTQMWLTGKSGTRLWVDIHGALLDPASGEAIWMLSDITSMKLYQEKVERLAFHDTLTGLPNRRLLDDRVKQALSMAQRRGEKVAVCFLDLDGFKPVNDRFGHECGDEVLKQTASRLLGAVREHDTVARLGGDEFVILLTNVAETDDPEAVMVRAVESLAMPYVIGGRHEVTISASFGLAVGPRDGASADELIQFADGAMYEYKRRARRYLADAQDVRCMQR